MAIEPPHILNSTPLSSDAEGVTDSGGGLGAPETASDPPAQVEIGGLDYPDSHPHGSPQPPNVEPLPPGTYVDVTSGEVFPPATGTATLPPPPGAVYLADGGLLIEGGVIANAAGEILFDPARQPADLTELVTQTYIDQLGRSGEEAGISYWVGQAQNMRSNGISDAAIQVDLNARFQDTDEYRMKEMIQGVYSEVLDRAGETAGVNGWFTVASELTAQGQSGDEVRAYLVEQFKLSDEGLARLVVATYREVTNTSATPAALPGLMAEARALRESGLDSRQIEVALGEQFALTNDGLHQIVRDAVEEVFDRPAELDEWVEYTGRALEYRDSGLTAEQVREKLTEGLRLSDEALSKVMVRVYADATGTSARPEALRGMWEEVVSMRDEGLNAQQIEGRLTEQYGLSGAGIQHTVRETYEQVFGGEFNELDAWVHWQNRATSLRDDEGLNSVELKTALLEEMRLSDDGLNHMISEMYGEELGQTAEFENVQEWMRWAGQLRDQGFSSSDIEGFLTSEYRRLGTPEGDSLLSPATVLYPDGTVHEDGIPPAGSVTLEYGGVLRSNGNILNHRGETVFDPDLGFLKPGARSAAGDMILADGTIQTRADFVAEGGWLPPGGAVVLGENDYRMDGYYQLENGRMLIDEGSWINANGQVLASHVSDPPLDFVRLEGGGVLDNGFLLTEAGLIALSYDAPEYHPPQNDSGEGVVRAAGLTVGLVMQDDDPIPEIPEPGHGNSQTEEQNLSALGLFVSNLGGVSVNKNPDGTVSVDLSAGVSLGRGVRVKDRETGKPSSSLDGPPNVWVSGEVGLSTTITFETEQEAANFIGLYSAELERESREGDAMSEQLHDNAAATDNPLLGAIRTDIATNFDLDRILNDLIERWVPAAGNAADQIRFQNIADAVGLDYDTAASIGGSAGIRLDGEVTIPTLDLIPGLGTPIGGNVVSFDVRLAGGGAFTATEHDDGSTTESVTVSAKPHLEGSTPLPVLTSHTGEVAGEISATYSIHRDANGNITGASVTYVRDYDVSHKTSLGANNQTVLLQGEHVDSFGRTEVETIEVRLPPGMNEVDAFAALDNYEDHAWTRTEEKYRTTGTVDEVAAGGTAGGQSAAAKWSWANKHHELVESTETSWLNPTGWEENAPGQGPCGDTGTTGGSGETDSPNRPAPSDGPCGTGTPGSTDEGSGEVASGDGPCGTTPVGLPPEDDEPTEAAPAQGPCGTNPYVAESDDTTDPEPIVISVQLADPEPEPEPIVISVQLENDEEETEDPPADGGGTCS